MLVTEVEWGPIDAAKPDPGFRDKFIETDLIKPALSIEYPIVSGGKGSGKTAIQKWMLTEPDRYMAKGLVSFNNLEFSAVAKNMSDLSSASDVQSLTIISHYWQYVIYVEAMKSWAKTIKESTRLGVEATRVVGYLRDNGLVEMGPLQMFLGLIATSWEFINKLTQGKTTKYPSLPSSLTSQVVTQVTNYPFFDQKFVAARNSFLRQLESDDHQVLILLDEFDDVRAKSGASRDQMQLIFDGLAQAVYNLTIEEEFAKRVVVKAMIPQDRFAAIAVRDLDKIQYSHWPLRWDAETLREFIVARVRHTHKNLPRNFYKIWPDVLPNHERIKNEVYDVQENSFDYLLRHTMYRPRHLQIHLDGLKRCLIVSELTGELIRRSVRDVSRALAEHFILENEIDHPNLKGFLSMFKGLVNVMTFGELFDIVKRALQAYGVAMPVLEKLNQLYEIGFWGFLQVIDSHKANDFPKTRILPATLHKGQRYVFDFHYLNRFENISGSLDSDALVCIHPVFFDYCDQRPHPHLLVA